MIIERDTYNNLERFFETRCPIKVTLQINGAATYDYCCFGLDANEKIADERYVIFYNQPSSPANEIVGANVVGGMEFTINLDDLPQTIQKLVFTASVDGAGNMREISSHKISIGDKISAAFDGSDFKRKKSIISAEIYRADGWQFNIAVDDFGGTLDGADNSEGTTKSFGRTVAKGALKAAKIVGNTAMEIGKVMAKSHNRYALRGDVTGALTAATFGIAVSLVGKGVKETADHVDKLLDKN